MVHTANVWVQLFTLNGVCWIVRLGGSPQEPVWVGFVQLVPYDYAVVPCGVAVVPYDVTVYKLNGCAFVSAGGTSVREIEYHC